MQTLKWVHLFEMHLYLPCLNGCLDVEITAFIPDKISERTSCL